MYAHPMKIAPPLDALQMMILSVRALTCLELEIFLLIINIWIYSKSINACMYIYTHKYISLHRFVVGVTALIESLIFNDTRYLFSLPSLCMFLFCLTTSS
jgi:hypothetical protein